MGSRFGAALRRVVVAGFAGVEGWLLYAACAAQPRSGSRRVLLGMLAAVAVGSASCGSHGAVESSPDPASVAAAAEDAASCVNAVLIQPDGRSHELGENLRHQVARKFLALRPVLDEGPEDPRRRALSSIVTLEFHLRNGASSAEREALLLELRSLEGAVRPWLQSTDAATAALATRAYAAVAEVETATAALSAALDRSEREVRKAALLGLRSKAPAAWRLTSKVLALAGDADLYEVATRALVELAPEPSLPREALSSADAGVRSAALEACARPACVDLAAEIAGRLEDRDAGVRRLACAALGAIGAAEHAPEVAKRLDDDDRRTRRAAAAALGNLDAAAERVAPMLGAALHSGDLELIIASLSALERFGPRAAAALRDVVWLMEQRPPVCAVRAATAAARLSAEWRARYVRVLETATEPVEQRRLAAAALGSPDDGESADALVRALDDPDPSVQEQAADSLKRIGAPAAPALPRLKDVSADTGRSEDVRRAARFAIGEIRESVRDSSRR